MLPSRISAFLKPQFTRSICLRSSASRLGSGFWLSKSGSAVDVMPAAGGSEAAAPGGGGGLGGQGPWPRARRSRRLIVGALQTGAGDGGGDADPAVGATRGRLEGIVDGRNGDTVAIGKM